MPDAADSAVTNMQSHPHGNSNDGDSYWNGIRSWISDFVAGTMGGVAGKYVEYPFDTVKVRLQTSVVGTFDGPVDCIKRIYAQDGFQGFYRGISAPVVGAAFENACLFSAFGQMKRMLTGTDKVELMTISEVIVAGGGAGLLVANVLTPVELLKCKMQVQTNINVNTITGTGGGASSNPSSVIYRSPWHCATEIFKTEGLRGLFKGYNSTIMREVPGNMAWFGAYETAVRAMTPAGHTRDQVPLYMNALSGGIGGVFYWLSMFPIDTIKSRQQSGLGLGNSNGSFSSTFKIIFKEAGVRGLYAGLGITLSRAIPSNAVIFTAYEYFSKMLQQ
jgi:hypothetical protein